MRVQGFTLVEMILTIVVVALAFAFAWPRDLRIDQQQSWAVQKLKHHWRDTQRSAMRHQEDYLWETLGPQDYRIVPFKESKNNPAPHEHRVHLPEGLCFLNTSIHLRFDRKGRLCNEQGAYLSIPVVIGLQGPKNIQYFKIFPWTGWIAE